MSNKSLLSYISFKDIIYFKVKVSNEKIDILLDKFKHKHDELESIIQNQRLSSQQIKSLTHLVENMSVEELNNYRVDDMITLLKSELKKEV